MLRNRTPEFKAYILSELVKNVWPKIEDGTIKPSIYKVLPMENAAEAHGILERGENVGAVAKRFELYVSAHSVGIYDYSAFKILFLFHNLLISLGPSTYLRCFFLIDDKKGNTFT